MFVLGTSGHVDHGKSTLLRKLTAMEPDRLPEEKEKGMTIDLNFVWMETKDFGTVGFVDVPGHQRFVKNMISGVTSIDAFLFVVAADDGWMPQSEEHLQVLQSLGVKRGFAVITKTDLVDPKRTAEVQREVSERLEKAFGKAVRTVASEPISLVKNELTHLLAQLPKPRNIQAAQVWVDRVFSPKGLGCVVTGTLREGSLTVGDELTLLPKGKTVLVKSLQSYQKTVTEALPVTRVALQLTKVDPSEVSRGMLLQKGKALTASRCVDTWVQWFETSPAHLKNTRMSFHLGTLTAPVLAIPFTKEIAPDSGVRLKFASPLPVRIGDKFLLKTSGEERNIGAGIVLDKDPNKLKQIPPELDLLNYQANKKRWVNLKEWADQSIYSYEEAKKMAATHASLKEIDTDVYVLKNQWELWIDQLKKALPELPPSVNEAGWGAFLTKNKVPGFLASRLTKEFARTSLIKIEKGIVYLGKKLDAAEMGVENKLLALFDEAKALPLNCKAALDDKSLKQTLQRLVQENRIIALGEGHYLRKEDFQAWSEKVKTYLTTKGGSTTSELKDVLKLSRKHAIFILEKLDSERLTYLKDGIRKLLK